VITSKQKLKIMTYKLYLYAYIFCSTHQYLSINFEIKNKKFHLNLMLRLNISDFNKIIFNGFKIWKFIYGVF
jgi:hypothetical protein